MSIIAEELGLVGVLSLMALFFWLIKRVILIGRQAIELEKYFSGLVAQGVGLWLGFQVMINMGVNLGALPTKGLTLPLLSYGGSAVLMMVLALVIVLRVDHENRMMMKVGAP
jgi:cell division protein FtsW